MNTSESITKVAPALLKAQKDMLPLIKDSDNPFFNSKYADLKAVTNACYPALQANGIAVLQSARKSDGCLDIITRLQHESGEWVETSCSMGSAKADSHGVASAITYGRRYGLMAAVGIAPEDDDGNAASVKHESTKPASDLKPPQRRVIDALNASPEWAEAEVVKPLSRAGDTLELIALEGDTKFLEKTLEYIEKDLGKDDVAGMHLQAAIEEAYKRLEDAPKKGNKS